MKISGNESGNLLLNLKHDSIESGVKNGNELFFSMVMNETSSSSRRESYNRDTSPAGNNTQDSYVNERVADTINRASEVTENVQARDDSTSAVNRNSEHEKTDRNNSQPENLNEKNKVSSEHEKNKTETVKDKKNSEQDELLTGLAGEIDTRKLVSLVQSAIKGEISDFSKKFRKFAEDAGLLKKNSSEKPGNVHFKADDKNLVSKEILSVLKSDFINQIGKELSRIITSRKGDTKQIPFTDKEMKEAIHSAADSIKKSRLREQIKTDLRKTPSEENRSDRKQDVITEHQTVRRKESGTDSGFDTGAGKERNSSREQSGITTAKIDSAFRTLNDKSDLTVKTPEFRQSLQEVIDKAKITVRDSNNGTFTVKLFPKELGSVNVNLLMENGVVSGRFLVENDEAKNQLLINLDTLKNDLADAGITVGEFSVNVSDDRRFANRKDEDDEPVIFRSIKGESAAAVTRYDNNSVSSSHDGHINMVI